MTDLPILFSAPMVRALLDGRKTMTRHLAWRRSKSADYKGRIPTAWMKVFSGDRLWVRESLAQHGQFGFPLGETDQIGAQGRVWSYAADAVAGRTGGIPSIHMPRWASRLTLTVTATKVERLQDISEEDAKAEGVDFPRLPHWPKRPYASAFRGLWRDLHGAESWDANPEVVAIRFVVHKCNIDSIPQGAPPHE